MPESSCMDLWALGPELVLAATGLLLVPVAGWARTPLVRRIPGLVAAAALTASMVLTARMLAWEPQAVFCDTYAVDGTAAVFKLLIELGGLLTLLAMTSHFRGHDSMPHTPIALLFSVLGGIGVASALDLGLIVLFLQMMSFASYLMVAALRGSRRAHEATLKYFLYAAVALAVMGYGLTFFYGLSGSLDLRRIGEAVTEADPVWVIVAWTLVLVGYGFETTLVPFHFWAPDVYDGTTAPVAGFVSVVPKIAGFAGLLRFVLTALPDGSGGWPLLLAVLAALTMTAGNLLALRQSGLVRLLAYSSIAQAGYVLAALSLAGARESAMEAVAYYLAAYLFMNLGAFLIAGRIERATPSRVIDLEALRGFGRSHVASAAWLAAALLSLAGFPPLAGFFGKVLVLRELLGGGLTWLAIVAIGNMAIALYYYLRVIGALFLEAPAGDEPRPEAGWGYALGVLGCVTGMLLLGVLPKAAMEVLDHVTRLVP